MKGAIHVSNGVISKYRLVPSAHMLLSSLRSVGYTFETALADIIDNSITAKADYIKVVFDLTAKSITIIDNGFGMSEHELIQSMAIGSSSPDKKRDFLDLGRFGMGLKTAAFSLGRCLTVVSKYNDCLANACWDLDYIYKHDDWNLKIYNKNSNIISRLSKYIKDYNNGTVVHISNIDRLIGTYENEKRRFYKTIEKVKSHLALVFHRFIEEDGLSIIVNEGNPIEAWNPFIKNNYAVQELEPEIVLYNDKEVTIQPYVLPHKTKFKLDEDFKSAGGYKGWLQHQGFYVYRNKRLIIFGTWFGIYKKETSYNLARIQLDICSDSDFDWQIDIKKSKAIPPTYIENAIKRAADNAIRQSVKVYNSRGVYSSKSAYITSSLSYVWEQRKNTQGVYSFFLNKKHTLLNKLKVTLNNEQKEILYAYLHLVEKCSPMIMSGVADAMSNNNIIENIKNDELKELIYKLQQLIQALKASGYDKAEILDLLEQIPEYSPVLGDFENLYMEVT